MLNSFGNVIVKPVSSNSYLSFPADSAMGRTWLHRRHHAARGKWSSNVNRSADLTRLGVSLVVEREGAG